LVHSVDWRGYSKAPPGPGLTHLHLPPTVLSPPPYHRWELLIGDHLHPDVDDCCCGCFWKGTS